MTHRGHPPERAYTDTLARNLVRLLTTGDLDEAGQALARLKETEPLARRTRGLELEYLVRANRTSEARELAAQLCEQFPDSARIRHWAGRAAYRARDYAAAAEAFRESARLAEHWRNRLWLGKALTQLGRLDEAEAELHRVRGASPLVERDLAWLHERRGEPEQALSHLEAYLEQRPDDTMAATQRSRLRGRSLSDAELIEEVESLEALGEPVPEALVPTYVQRLLAHARGREARGFIAANRGEWSSATVKAVAWVCYQARVWDLALDGFQQVLDEELTNVKFLAALEKAARQCRRVDELIEAYAARAPECQRLYGRIKRLERARSE